MNSMKKYAVLGLAVLSLAMMAHSGAGVYHGNDVTSGYEGRPFDMVALQDIIKTNSVTTLDELLPLLPETYKKYFTLMVKSGSLQSASQDSPRVIAYGNHDILESIYPAKNLDRLYLAYQTEKSEGSKLPNSLEAIEWSPESKTYQFYEIDFPYTSNSVKVNPVTCKVCHGETLRPNWTAYPRWDGSIGNHNGLDGIYSHPGPFKNEDLAKKKFADLKAKNTRLGTLNFDQYFESGLEFPNAYLSGKIGSQLISRNLKLIESRQDYAQFKYAIAGAFMGCVNAQDFFNPAVYSELQSGVYDALNFTPQTKKRSEISSARALSFQSLVEMTKELVQKSIHFSAFDNEALVTAWMRLIYEGQGHPEVLKSILGTPPASPMDETWSYDLVGFGSRFDDVRNEYFRTPPSDLGVAPRSLFTAYIDEVNWTLTHAKTASSLENGPALSTCVYLAEQSRVSTSNFVRALTKKELSFNPNPLKSAAVLSQFTQYCMECHNAATRYPLPLKDLSALKAYLTKDGRTIAERLKRMEMPRPEALQPSEDTRKQMIDLLEN